MLPVRELNDLSVAEGFLHSKDRYRSHRQQHDRTVQPNRVARHVVDPDDPVEHVGEQMDQQIGKAKGIASNHPPTVRENLLLKDVDHSHYRHNQPNYIEKVKSYAAYFSSRSARRHVPQGQHDNKNGRYMYVAVYPSYRARWRSFPLI